MGKGGATRARLQIEQSMICLQIPPKDHWNPAAYLFSADPVKRCCILSNSSRCLLISLSAGDPRREVAASLL